MSLLTGTAKLVDVVLGKALGVIRKASELGIILHRARSMRRPHESTV